jgi:hypothetical protein
MARIKTVRPERARGLQRLALWMDRRKYGEPLGITQVMLPDLRVGMAAALIYRRLHLRKRSSLTRLQREMLPPSSTGRSAALPDWGFMRRPCAA